MPPLDSALILGGLGQAGGLLAGAFLHAGAEVTYADRHPRPDSIPPRLYLQADVNRPDAALFEKIAATSCIVVCLPEETALSAAPAILNAMADGALWVDALSIKTGICRVLSGCRRKLEMLSINPMFAPALGWNGRPVAVVELSGGQKTDAFVRALRDLKAAVESLTAEMHDSLTAAIQVATHAAILSFGMILTNLDYDISKGWAIATPPHRLLLALLSRIVSANPEVYWDIQHHHPEAERVRCALTQAVADLDAASKASPLQFAQVFEQLQARLSSRRELLQSLSDRIVSEAAKGDDV